MAPNLLSTGERGVARRGRPVVAPQPDIVPFVIKRVNDESLLAMSNDSGATAVTPSCQGMNAVVEATGIGPSGAFFPLARL